VGNHNLCSSNLQEWRWEMRLASHALLRSPFWCEIGGAVLTYRSDHLSLSSLETSRGIRHQVGPPSLSLERIHICATRDVFAASYYLGKMSPTWSRWTSECCQTTTRIFHWLSWMPIVRSSAWIHIVEWKLDPCTNNSPLPCPTVVRGLVTAPLKAYLRA
jgi:hypothetical protein